jgi:2,3-bisphosphoglycerate-dependent phosphoglycerate mutase
MIDEVILLRHGRTSYNLAHKLQGQIDVPLDIVGQWQVTQTGMELAQRYYWAKMGNIVDHPERLAQPGPQAAMQSDVEEYRQASASKRRMRVISSDLFRAVQTAHAFADILGLPVELDKRIRERSFGRWEGLSYDEIRQLDPDAFHSWRAGEGGEARYGVESRTALGKRGAEAINALVAEHEDDQWPTTLLLVTHGSFMAATIETMIGLDPEVDTLGSIQNAFWTRLAPVRKRETSEVSAWKLEEFNGRPKIAMVADWDNGPEELRNPSMPQASPFPQLV